MRAGPQIVAIPMLLLYKILHTMWSGKSLQLLYILPFGILCLSAFQYDVCKKYVGSVYVGGYGGLAKVDSVSSVNCVQSAFL